MKTIRFEITRYHPGGDAPYRINVFPLAVHEFMTVLEALETIRTRRDASLMFRRSCRHASCGTCAMIINGKERLACTTNIWRLQSDTVSLNPLKGFKKLGDLVVDMSPFYTDMGEKTTCLTPSEASRDGYVFERLENCIECGACDSSCPAVGYDRKFMGPAACAALHREITKTGTVGDKKEKELLKRASGKRGVNQCERALNCSKACPKGVYPAMHIQRLKLRIDDASE